VGGPRRDRSCHAATQRPGMPSAESLTSTRIHEEIESLRHMTVGQLKDKYRQVFGEETRSNHKQFLFPRIAWRIPANAWGGLMRRLCW